MPEPDEQKVCTPHAISYLFNVFLYLFYF